MRGRRRRALLALLLLNANRAVSVNRAIDALWADRMPVSARAQVQALIHALRQQLAVLPRCGPDIETRPEGYALLVDPGLVDLLTFERRVADARAALAAGRLAEAAAGLRQALALWRGPALYGVDAPFVPGESMRLEEGRLLVVEELAEVEIALGRHARLASEMTAIARQHPFRERLQAAFMLALYRSGRRAEALEVYRRTRRAMVEELGLSPGRELQELERAILKDSPSLQLDRAAAERHLSRVGPTTG